MQSRKRDHAHIQTLISFIHWNQEDEEAVELCDIFFSFYQTIYVRDKKKRKTNYSGCRVVLSVKIQKRD